MKQSQWVLAALLLAGVVFIATFAMNYLGGNRPGVEAPTLTNTRELVFAQTGALIEREERTSGFVDFWFHNPHQEAVEVGLNRKSCQCGGVEVFVLPDDPRPWLTSEATALLGIGQGNPLGPLGAHVLAQEKLQKGVEGHELLKKTEKSVVAGGQVGWVRVSWSSRKAGPQSLEAQLWFDTPLGGKIATLTLYLYFQPALRAVTQVRVRTVGDDDLQRGVTEYITCWSSTRPSFRLEATTTPLRGNPASDPFVVGKPQPLSEREIAQLRFAHNDGSKTANPETRGSVLSGYRVPITLRPVSADGKVPFDIGPFHREVSLHSPDIDGEPIIVTVRGRVRGLVEMGNEDGEGVNFASFLRKRGSRWETIALESANRGLKLEFDRERTPAFLDASRPERVKASDFRQEWVLKARVLPDKADGDFPRAKDPLYEDSAIYLKALLPGKAPRSIRIPVKGSAR